MQEHINISLIREGVSRDLRIPTRIEVRTLIMELNKIFGLPLMMRKCQLRVVNKGILLDEGKVLADYPVTSGDVIEIEEFE
ncbi:EsaB/YukD family protein [Streptococcus caprae]|uniref:EsaB/YukD family protein n=1 Tax=Streptococcus caprae TaxID=1640501 RepID=A0ABV8CWH8_9STRE